MSSDLEEFLRRKRDLDRKKNKLHLTELDAGLLFSGADEYQFQDGETIIEQGQLVSNVFRIKNGTANIVKNGQVLTTMSQGVFLNERIFLVGTSIAPFSVVAKGSVTLVQMDLAYVKKLFQVDHTLALRFYRGLVLKLSNIFYAITGNISGIVSGVKLNEKLVNNPDEIQKTEPQLEVCKNLLMELKWGGGVAPKKQPKKIKRTTFEGHRAYKEYSLDTGKGEVVKLLHDKIHVGAESFGFHKSKHIKFVDIKTTAKLTEDTISLIYLHNGHKKGKTLFLKTQPDADELFGLLNSMIQQAGVRSQNFSGSRLSFYESSEVSTGEMPSLAQSSSSVASADEEVDDEETRNAKALLFSMAETIDFKKGDVVLREGDLFQRIYHIVEGTFRISQDGVELCTLEAGETFGEATILFLRPFTMTITTTSPTGKMRMISGYKINDILYRNDTNSVQLYRACAKLIDEKVLSMMTGTCPNKRSGSQSEGSVTPRTRSPSLSSDSSRTSISSQ